MDGITIGNVFLFYQIKEIDCMLIAVCLFQNKSQKTSKCGLQHS